MDTYRCLWMFCLLFILVKSSARAQEIVTGNTYTEKSVRSKREIYFTFQDRAQVICIGLCASGMANPGSTEQTIEFDDVYSPAL
ncbi:hypothetical protein LSH36_64g00018 [Paralvinella palmiformis]|uniref:Uncharacterized protein n=1 Tax=Paralvinella palmiformis TaxID=53620 RepID=A0AAD9K3S0_9ANNE|nr:hypothetical protein LSH36_64g00018 [Paralvinella palmiformis]